MERERGGERERERDRERWREIDLTSTNSRYSLTSSPRLRRCLTAAAELSLDVVNIRRPRCSNTSKGSEYMHSN